MGSYQDSTSDTRDHLFRACYSQMLSLVHDRDSKISMAKWKLEIRLTYGVS